MEYSEKYGKDVDEAVRLALTELGLREDQVMVTVLEEPTKGFLGIGGQYAKVRVEKIDDTPVEGDDLSQAEALAQAEKPKTKATHDFRKKGRGESEGGGMRQERSGGGRGSDRGGRDRDRDKDRGGRGRDRDKDRGRDGGAGRHEGQEPDIDVSGIEHVSAAVLNLVPDPENKSAKFLADVLAKMGLSVQVEGFSNDECNYMEVKGSDSRLVIGKRGQTLDALQYLTNQISNKGEEKYKRVIIDVEGYRSRREKTLEQLAVKLARKVLSSGRPAKLEPMNPYERKVIHSTLQGVEGIVTKSEGDEPYRRVIIKRK